MLQRLIDTVTRHRLFQPGDALGVAVSGGADSVALLHLLVELARSWNLSLTVLHLNHQLRGSESDGDARFVDRLACSLHLPVVVESATVPPGNLEQEARRARRAFFRRAMRDRGLTRVALGHTRDDQAETVLFRFLRGTGPTGLAGIQPATSDGFVRPLLDIARAEIREYLAAAAVPWREDSSNANLRFARNRIRHQLLPELVRDWNPQLPALLANLSGIARDEERYWQAEVARLDAVCHRPPACLLHLPRLEGIHPALLRRVLRHAVGLAKGDLRRITSTHIEGLAVLALKPEGYGRLVLPGLEACRSFDWMRLAPPARRREGAVALEVPGQTWWNGMGVHAEVLESPSGLECGYNNDAGIDLDWDRLSGPLELRGWIPGDAFQPVGYPSIRKLKDLFQQERIPSWERPNWPMITVGRTIYWVRGFGPAAEVAARAGTGRILRVKEVGNRDSDESKQAFFPS